MEKKVFYCPNCNKLTSAEEWEYYVSGTFKCSVKTGHQGKTDTALEYGNWENTDTSDYWYTHVSPECMGNVDMLEDYDATHLIKKTETIINAIKKKSHKIDVSPEEVVLEIIKSMEGSTKEEWEEISEEDITRTISKLSGSDLKTTSD